MHPLENMLGDELIELTIALFEKTGKHVVARIVLTEDGSAACDLTAGATVDFHTPSGIVSVCAPTVVKKRNLILEDTKGQSMCNRDFGHVGACNGWPRSDCESNGVVLAPSPEGAR